MALPGLLIVVSGPSGTGKGTICKALFQRRPDIFFSVSATTRPPRAGDIDGVHYKFMNKKSFEEMLAEDEFLEWAQVYGNYYGTPRQPVMDALKAGKDVLLEIDVQGALKIKEKAPEGIYIFIVPPTMGELRRRITGRGTDAPEVIEKRLREALGELSHIHEYNYVVVNDLLEQAVLKADSIIAAEKLRSGRFRLADDSGPDRPLVVTK